VPAGKLLCVGGGDCPEKVTGAGDGEARPLPGACS